MLDIISGVTGRFLAVPLISFLLSTGSTFAAPFAYISNNGGNSVSVIDTASNLVTASIPVGTNPQGVAVAPVSGKVYAANSGSGSVSVIDTASNAVTRTITVGTSPLGAVVSPDEKKLYVANFGSNTVSVIDTATGTVTATIPVSSYPLGVAITPDSTKVFVACGHTNSVVSVISTVSNTVIATIPVGGGPLGIAVTPDGSRAYVANYYSGSVSVINTATHSVVATIGVPFNSYGLAISPDGAKVYVTSVGGSITVISTASNNVTASIPLGSAAFGVSFTPDGSRAYATIRDTDAVKVINAATNAVIGTVSVGDSPLPLGTFIPAGYPVTSGLVSIWRGEANALDSRGSNNGSWVGTPAYGAGKSGQAFSLNGVDQKVTVSESFAVGSDPFTLSFWLKPAALTENTYLVGKSSPDEGLGFDLRLHNDTIQVVGIDGWDFNITSPPLVTSGEWHHVLLSATATEATLYVDGIVAGTSPRSSISGTGNPFSMAYTASFGGAAYSGLMDEVAIYNRALTAGEIQSLASGTPVATIPFRDEFSGSLRPEWQTTNPDPSTLALQASSLRIMAAHIDNFDPENSEKNLFTVPLPAASDNYQVTVKLSFPNPPTEHGPQGGILLAADNGGVPDSDNYLRLMYSSEPGYTCITSIGETDGALFGARKEVLTLASNEQLWLRIRKSGTSYTLLYSLDGRSFIPVQALTGDWMIAHAGIYAIDAAGTTIIPVDFDYFEISDGSQLGSQPSGVISWWGAEENGLDAMGINHATLAGGPSFDIGTVSRAMSLNGGSQYGRVASPVKLPLGASARTIAGWIKCLEPTSGTKYQTMLGYGSPGTDGGAFLLEWGGDVNDRRLYLTGWNADLAGSSQLVYGQWYHVAATYDGTTAKLYVNGVEDGSGSRVLSTVTNSDGLLLGSSPPTGNDGWHSYFNGLIDEVVVFDRALSATEVQAVYHAGSDMVPEPFTFTPQAGVPLNISVVSNPITVSGIGSSANIDISGGNYAVSVDNGATWGGWTNSPGTVNLNDQVKVMQTSADNYAISTDAILTIGGVSGTFRVTTVGTRLQPGPGQNDGTDQGTADAGKDAFVYKGQPATNYGSEPNIYIVSNDGPDCYNDLSTAMGYLRFDLGDPALPAATGFAKIRLYANTVVPPFTPVDLYAVAADWDEMTIAYGNRPARGAQVATVAVEPVPATGWYEFDITPLYNQWKAGTLPNYGVEIYTLTCYANASHDRYFTSSDAIADATLRPMLVVGTAADVSPAPFSFIGQTDVNLSTVIASGAITVSGIDAPAPAIIDGGEFEVNGSGVWLSTGTVNNGDTVMVRQTSSAGYGLTTTATLSIGGVSAGFQVATLPPTLTIALAGTGTGAVEGTPAGITCGSDCSQSYDRGTTVSLTATPAADSRFAGWSGACAGSGACDVTMDDLKSVTATFARVIAINGGNAFTGTASATLALDHPGAVQMQLFTGSTWSAWMPYVSPKAVTFPAGDGLKTVSVRFKDGNDNISGIYSDSIVLDTKAPVGSVTIDGGAGVTTSPTVTLSLVVADDSTVTEMQVSNSATWPLTWEPYTATKAEWPLSDGYGTKTVSVRFRDSGGKISATAKDTILYSASQTVASTGQIVINGGADSTTLAGVKLTITSPGAGYTLMSLSSNGTTWSGWSAIPATAKAYTLPAGDGVKTVFVKFKGAAAPESGIYTASIVLDTKPPVGTIVINGGAAVTRVATVGLTLSAADLNGVTSMQFSRDGINWGTWETYDTSGQIDLLPGDGTRKVMVKFKDGAGKISAAYTDTIIVDTKPPVGKVTINGGATSTTSTLVTVALAAPGAVYMQLSLDNGSTWRDWEPFVGTTKVTLGPPAAVGPWGVKARFRDLAGNVSVEATDTIAVTVN